MAGKVELDSIDRALLSELQKDARQTNKALAAKVGVAIETLLEHVRKAPETQSVMALTGTTDFIIHVAVRDMDHLRDFVWKLSERREVARLQSSLIFAHADGPELMPLD